MSWHTAIPEVNDLFEKAPNDFFGLDMKEIDYFYGKDLLIKGNASAPVDYGIYTIHLEYGLFNNEKSRCIANLVSFDLMYYPACCAMLQLNNFYYNSRSLGSQESLNQMIASLIKTYEKAFETKVRRLILNCVELPRMKDGTLLHEYDEVPTDVEVDVDRMKFPKMYIWAKSQKHFQEMVFVNHNTWNIIHCCEVLLK